MSSVKVKGEGFKTFEATLKKLNLTERAEINDLIFDLKTTKNFSFWVEIIKKGTDYNDEEIKSVGNDLVFSCDGNFASSKIYRTQSDGNMEFLQKSDASVIIQGEFSLKSLSHFIKCTPLCSHLEMYLGNDLPLIVKYDVASLGEIRLCLAPLPPS